MAQKLMAVYDWGGTAAPSDMRKAMRRCSFTHPHYYALNRRTVGTSRFLLSKSEASSATDGLR